MTEIYNSSTIIHYAVSLLQSGLTNPEWPIRFATAEVFAVLQDPQGVDELERGLTNQDALIRDRAVVALGKLRRQSLQPEFQRALLDSDHLVRGHAVEALAMACGSEAIPEIENAARSSNAFVQKCAVMALSLLTEGLGQPLLEAITLATDGYACAYPVRLSAAFYLAQANSRSGQEFLAAMLVNHDNWIAFIAAQNLAKLGDMRAAPLLRQALAHGDWPQKVAAIEGLLQLGIEENLVGELYRPDSTPDLMTQIEIVRLLDRFAPSNTELLLRQAFAQGNEDIKIRVLQIIGELRRSDLVPIADQIIAVGPEHLRAHLLAAIEKIADPELLPFLAPLLENSHFLVRLQTARVVLQICG